MNEDERAIRALIEEWIRATAAGEVDAVARLMTDDVVFLTTRSPPMDKATFVKGMRGSLSEVLIECESDIQEIRVEGSMAWCWNRLAVRLTPRAGGTTNVIEGTTLGIYLKGDDGQWRLHRDANMMA